MDATTAPLLRDVLPDLASVLEERLIEQDEPDLAEQVATLRLVAPCSCRDDFCGSFYTAPRPAGAWGPGHENVVIEGNLPGDVILDVVDRRIMYVEVLFWDEIRDAVARVST